MCINLKISIVTVNFDHFQILRAIGKGSFGKVSKCIVIKCLTPPNNNLLIHNC